MATPVEIKEYGITMSFNSHFVGAESSTVKHLFGDLYYDDRPNRTDFFHKHGTEKVSDLVICYREGRSFSKCIGCDKEFPTYKKLKTMVGLKELTNGK